MNARLQIRLLSSFDLTYDGARVPPIEKSARLQSLLAYLLLNTPRPQTRRQIAFTFWPDTTESQARTNLRKLIYQLQNRLPDVSHYLKIGDHSLQWNAASSYCLDVDQLEAALQSAERDPTANEAIADVIRLYKGVLLPDASEAWLSERREELQRRITKALTNRADYLEMQASLTEATVIVQRLLLLNPFEEALYQRLMRLRARANDRSGAIRAYNAARAMLEDELGVTPSPQTQFLYERIVSGQPFSGGAKNAGKDEPVIPFIGRQSEWKNVQAFCASLQPRHSRCIWVFGDAGIGKTRFAEELLSWAYLDGYAVVRTRSYGAGGDLAYAPVAQLLRRSELSERVVRLADVWLSEISRILPELLVERPDLPRPGPLSQGGQKLRFYEALCNAVLPTSRPVMLFFDDLQWCDEETFAWLHYLLRREHDSRLLVVGAYRDDEIDMDHPLRAISNSLFRDGQLLDVGLSPLAPEDTTYLAEAVYQNRLDAAVRRDLFRSTKGNPLFVVEIMRARLNGVQYHARGRVSDTRSGASVDLPATIFSLIQHRLGKLSPLAQETLKLAALIGRSFEHRLLAAAGHVTEETVVAALTELCHKRIVREQRAGVFDFTHDKLRDVALTQVGDTRKRLLSRQIAEAYELIYVGRLDDIVGELAVAYEGAGQYSTAVTYYHQAAQAENRRGAYKRAETYIEKALALINEARGQTDLAAVELTLQLSLGNVARVIQRNTVPKAGTAFTRALELSETTGDLAGRFQALYALAQFHMTDADLVQANDFCRQCITVAQQIGDQARLIRSYLMFGFICLIRGEFRPARENLEQVCSHYNSDLAELLTTLQGEDTGVMANIHLSVILWFLGYPEQSNEKMTLAHAIARELGLPINRAFVCFYQMMLSLIKYDIPAAGRFANRLVEMSEKYEIGFTLIAGHAGQAYVAASQDPDNPSLIEAFERQLDLYHEQVSRLSQPFFLSLKARLLMDAERYEEAQAVLTKAVALLHALDDRYSAGEIYRLQGKLWTITGAGSPEESYLQAIALTGKQKARMLQLRAAVSLCRFWQQQSRQAEAHRLLSEIYDWFSEGDATSELQEVQALLSDLAQ